MLSDVRAHVPAEEASPEMMEDTADLPVLESLRSRGADSTVVVVVAVVVVRRRGLEVTVAVVVGKLTMQAMQTDVHADIAGSVAVVVIENENEIETGIEIEIEIEIGIGIDGCRGEGIWRE